MYNKKIDMTNYTKSVIGFAVQHNDTFESNCLTCGIKVYLEKQDLDKKPYCFVCPLKSSFLKTLKKSEVKSWYESLAIMSMYGFRYEEQLLTSSLSSWIKI